MKKNKSLFLVVSFVLFLVGVVSFLVPFWNMTAKTILSSESSSTAFNFLDDIDGVKSLYQASNLEFKAEGAVLTTKICVLVAFAALALFFVFQYGQASKLNRLISIVLACLGLLAAVVAIVCIIIAGAQGKASNSLVAYTFRCLSCCYWLWLISSHWCTCSHCKIRFVICKKNGSQFCEPFSLVIFDLRDLQI